MARFDPAQLEALCLDQPEVLGLILHVGYRDLDVDNGLCGQTGHRSGAHVVDAYRPIAKGRCQPRADFRKSRRPNGVVVHYGNGLVARPPNLPTAGGN